MLAGQALNVVDLILIAISGMAIVMLELALIAVMIYLITFITNKLAGEKKKDKKKSGTQDNDGEVNAVIMSVISEDMGVPLEELVFTSIKEV